MKRHRFGGKGPYLPGGAGDFGCVDCGAWTTHCMSFSDAECKMGECRPAMEAILQSEWAKGWNPRVVLWMHSAGLPFDAIEKVSSEDTPIVRLPDGTHNLWTLAFTEWVDKAWKEWAASLGYLYRSGAEKPHIAALLDGHTGEDFDAWLLRRART